MTQMRKFEQEAIAKEILNRITINNSKQQNAMEKSSKELKNIRKLYAKAEGIQEQESLEYNLGELEMRVDEIESIDIENLKDNLKYEVNSLKDEVNEVLSNFESMTEGYTVSVKLNPPL